MKKLFCCIIDGFACKNVFSMYQNFPILHRSNDSTVSTIKMLDFLRIHRPYKEELSAVLERVMNSGQYIGGPDTANFEANLSEYLGAQTIGVANGTDALQIALMVLGIGPGDEVIVPAFTYAASAEVIGLLGATAIWCDVDERTFNLDIDQLATLRTPHTKAIIVVHLYGRCADVAGVEQALPGVTIVEDTAQAFGAKWTSGPYAGQYAGTIGAFGSFSFFPTKSLGGMGDGGAICSRDTDLLALAKRIASHGQSKKYHHQCIGVNSRLDPIQAAVLGVKLKYFNLSVERKKRIASIYLDELNGVDGLIIPDIVDGHIIHQFTIRILGGKRYGLQAFLKERGIDSMIYYPIGLHQQEAYKNWAPRISLQVTERLSHEVLSLPVHEAMEIEEVKAVVDSIKSYLS